MSDYADRWAAREQYLNTLSLDEKQFYVAGLAHAYGDVFNAFGEAFAGNIPCDVHAIFERLHAQWDDVVATQTVRGVL